MVDYTTENKKKTRNKVMMHGHFCKSPRLCRIKLSGRFAPCLLSAVTPTYISKEQSDIKVKLSLYAVAEGSGGFD
jgi:hypothetical protein